MQEREILIWLSHIGGINLKTIEAFKDYFGSLAELWNVDEKHLYQVLDKRRIIADKITQNRNKSYLEKIQQKLLEENIKPITIGEDHYPDKLRDIYDPPYVIYIKGSLNLEKPLISIVGSRKASPYGKWAAYQFAKELSQWGIGVVSGLALGIDTASHKGALENNGYTIGVLGCGIDKCYPTTNTAIMNKMIDSGCIMGEYSPGTPPLKHHFPARNRIISGISDGIIIVEAAEKSGALITVDFALEQGKEIYALPGNINQQQSRGTNLLIKDGAKILLGIEDILEDLEKKYPIRHQNTNKAKGQLSPLEEKILLTVKEGQPSIDHIAYKCGIKVNELSSILTILELKGFISQLPGKTFIAN